MRASLCRKQCAKQFQCSFAWPVWQIISGFLTQKDHHLCICWCKISMTNHENCKNCQQHQESIGLLLCLGGCVFDRSTPSQKRLLKHSFHRPHCYLCETGFSAMNTIKKKSRSWLQTLEEDLRACLSTIWSLIRDIVRHHQAQVSHWYFYAYIKTFYFYSWSYLKKFLHSLY
jgi:hypothetical protein